MPVRCMSECLRRLLSASHVVIRAINLWCILCWRSYQLGNMTLARGRCFHRWCLSSPSLAVKRVASKERERERERDRFFLNSCEFPHIEESLIMTADARHSTDKVLMVAGGLYTEHNPNSFTNRRCSGSDFPQSRHFCGILGR